MSNPPFLPHAFAEAALPANITSPVPDAPTGTRFASWQQGFPPITMTPLTSGGQPPAGADMNGVLNAVTEHTVFQQQGGIYAWDATTGAAGYPKGAVVMLDDNATCVISVVAGNTHDPNAGILAATGWAPYHGANVGGVMFCGVAGGSANAIVLTAPLPSPLTTPHSMDGARFVFVASATNTSSAVTLTANAAGSNLFTSTNTTIQPGDIVAGAMYEVVYDATVPVWRLLTRVASEVGGGSVGNATNFSTSSTTDLMGGVNVSLMPTGVHAVIGWSLFNSGGGLGVGGVAKLRVGTGAPPAPGAAASGTVVDTVTIPATTGPNYSMFLVVPVVPYTRNWVDFSFAAASASTATANCSATMQSV